VTTTINTYSLIKLTQTAKEAIFPIVRGYCPEQLSGLDGSLSPSREPKSQRRCLRLRRRNVWSEESCFGNSGMIVPEEMLRDSGQ